MKPFYFSLMLVGVAASARATVLTFDAVTAAPCTDGTAYMASFGISVTGSASARICLSAPVGGAQAFSGPNLLLLDTPLPSNSTYTFFFVFDNPVSNVSFVRTRINPDSTGPAWTATALSAGNVSLASTGEGTTFAPAAMVFNLTAIGIASIRFDTNNTSARTYNVPPIDDFSFTASVPEPSTWALLISGLAVGAIARRRRAMGSQ